MSYKRIVVTRRGPPDVLRVVETDLRAPSVSEVRVRVLATCVCRPDVQARYGFSPFAPSIPFVPGYAVVGEVDAHGSNVTRAAVGDRVAALMIVGGYAEYVYLRDEQIIPVPAGVEPAEAVTLVLNYLVAYQALHRSAKVRAGDKVLIIGASGGIGTAFLELGRLAGLTMFAIASKHKHAALVEYGATPIDYRSQDFVEVVRRAEPGGLHAVFDGVGGGYLQRGLSVLRRGGSLIAYGNPGSLRNLFRLLLTALTVNVMPNGKRVKLYGTSVSWFNRRIFQEDWAVLFRWLADGRIHPVISGRFPLLEAARANALLESGEVVGNLVLLAPSALRPSNRVPGPAVQATIPPGTRGAPAPGGPFAGRAPHG
jgi:NADPH:quinone reductase-like Zn-dependent oxidoreductase